MCLLIAKPAGVKVQKKYLQNGFRENPHGAGFAVAVDGKLLMRKGFFNFKQFWKSYREFQEYSAVIHYRWANIGPQTVDNCHPFIVDENLIFAHNGTISITRDDEKKSDTRTFCEKIARECRKYDYNFLQDETTRWFLSKSIGNSKLAFIDSTGELTIINKERGQEHEGTWFSNDDYKKFPSKKNSAITYTVNGKQITREEWYENYYINQGRGGWNGHGG